MMSRQTSSASAREDWLQNDPWHFENSRWELKAWSGSYAVNRCGGFMNASSESSRSKVSRSIHDCSEWHQSPMTFHHSAFQLLLSA
jgi:hypothetical protein